MPTASSIVVGGCVRPLIIITNNGLIAAREYAAFALPAGCLDIRCTMFGVFAVPKGAEIIIERYGVGKVKCEVCSTAEALVWVGHLARTYKSELSTRKNDHEPVSS